MCFCAGANSIQDWAAGTVIVWQFTLCKYDSQSDTKQSNPAPASD